MPNSGVNKHRARFEPIPGRRLPPDVADQVKAWEAAKKIDVIPVQDDPDELPRAWAKSRGASDDGAPR